MTATWFLGEKLLKNNSLKSPMLHGPCYTTIFSWEMQCGSQMNGLVLQCAPVAYRCHCGNFSCKM